MPRTKSTRRSSKASVALNKMPQDDLHDLVVEGRELRDALRAHTRELSKEIQNKVEKSIASQIADIKSYVSHSAPEGEALPKSHERTSIFLQEAQNLIDESLSSHLDEVKKFDFRPIFSYGSFGAIRESRSLSSRSPNNHGKSWTRYFTIC